MILAKQDIFPTYLIDGKKKGRKSRKTKGHKHGRDKIRSVLKNGSLQFFFPVAFQGFHKRHIYQIELFFSLDPSHLHLLFSTSDHHEYTTGSPLMALLLLLGIPAWICCCCRKKIFRPKATAATLLQVLTVGTSQSVKTQVLYKLVTQIMSSAIPLSTFLAFV